ncbi:RNB domain-containing ribonuclease, partial [Klebsiella pneumoniae]
HARLTYTKVWHMLQGDQELREHYAPLVKHIEELHNLYKVLESAREERGGISFESEEAKFIFNAERRIERIEQTQRNDAHKLIEECM